LHKVKKEKIDVFYYLIEIFIDLGSEIKLIMRRDLPMEIDGEPFLLGPCQITITRKNQARMIITERSQAAQQIQSKRV